MQDKVELGSLSLDQLQATLKIPKAVTPATPVPRV